MAIKINKYRIGAAALLIVVGWWWFCALPDNPFDRGYGTCLYSRDMVLLGATIADDGQWRFPQVDRVPDKFATSLVHFEDERFYHHPGVDPIAIIRALSQNIEEGRIVSGASTISMQVVRLMRQNQPRTWTEKMYEIILAIRLECRYSKQEILGLWSSHAPFGGNVVGLEAATWRYYGRSPESLSWGEAATLAVLPNAPSIIHPGKNNEALLNKRNRLLDKMVESGVIDSLTASLAAMEELTGPPKPMPQMAPHLLMKFKQSGLAGERIVSSVDANLQAMINRVVDRHHKQLSQNEIHNAAVLLLHVPSQQIKAYVGNTEAGALHGEQVDVVTAPRSSGSILKPFLYAAMNQVGELLPQELLADIPTQVNGYRPLNFDNEYEGAVHADEALSRSLNIPAVRMLQDFGIDQFRHKLKQLNFSSIHRTADHYGLSLILGGAEVTLWDLTRNFGAMARSLNRFHHRQGKYEASDWSDMSLLASDEIERQETSTSFTPPIDAGASYLTFEALTSVNRPASEFGWNKFSTARRVGWKTGTSIGFRDAWAIGVTPEYVVAVWVGNADGEGRPGLVGVQAAAPILFDIFQHLPPTTWFEPPYDELRMTSVCIESGMKSGPNCPENKKIQVHENGERALPCKYHERLFLDESGRYEVTANCYPSHLIQSHVQFVLPPIMAHYYKKKHMEYREKPPWYHGCSESIDLNRNILDVVYPQQNALISLPKDISGKKGEAVFEVAHMDAKKKVFWHLDNQFVGSTENHHVLTLHPPEGVHKLKVVDSDGNEVERIFKVVN